MVFQGVIFLLQVHRKTIFPEFRESFVFDIPEADVNRQTVRINLYDYDQYSRDECIGTVELPLTNVDLSEKLEVWKGIRAPPSVCTPMVSRLTVQTRNNFPYIPQYSRKFQNIPKFPQIFKLDFQYLCRFW